MVLAAAPTENEVAIRFPRPRYASDGANPDLRPQRVDWSDPDAVAGYNHLRELVSSGTIGQADASRLPVYWCLCGHYRSVHDGGPCGAHRCPCQGFHQDVRYLLE